MKDVISSSIFYKTLSKTDGKEFIISSLIDFGFYLMLYIGLWLWGAGIKIPAKVLKNIDLNTIAYQKASELNATLANMKGFLFFLILFLILYIVYALACVTFFKGIIYSRIAGKQFTRHQFIQFLKYNLLWYFCSAFVIIILVMVMRQSVAGPLIFGVGIAFLLYLTVIYQSVFALQQKKILLTTMYAGVQRIHKFILPLLILIIIFVLITFIARGFAFIPRPFASLLSGAIILLYFSLARHYLANVVKAQIS